MRYPPLDLPFARFNDPCDHTHGNLLYWFAKDLAGRPYETGFTILDWSLDPAPTTDLYDWLIWNTRPGEIDVRPISQHFLWNRTNRTWHPDIYRSLEEVIRDKHLVESLYAKHRS